MGIKLNYYALSREYNIDRYTIRKYHINGGIIRENSIKNSKFEFLIE